MVAVISEKLEELRRVNPANPDFRKWLEQSNLWYWLYSDLNLQGIRVGKRQVVDVLDGQLLENTPMNVYGYIHRFAGIYREMISAVEMSASLSLKLMDGWYAELFDPEEGESLHRSLNSAVYEWGYIPPHFNEINPLSEQLFRKTARERFDGNFIDRLTAIYTGVLRIRAYGERTVPMAGLAMVYTLIEEGLPLPQLPVSEQEFNELAAEIFEHDNYEPMRDMLERCILNRLDAVLLLAKEAAEEE